MVTVRDPQQESRRAADPDLQVKLEQGLPAYLTVGQPTAVFCYGHCFHRHLPVTDLEIVAGGQRHWPAATRMPRRDL